MGGRDSGSRLLVGVATIILLAGCAAGASPTPVPASPTPTSMPSATLATPTLAPAEPSPSTSAANYWPFVESFCPGASEQPLNLVALGMSETAGYGIRSDELYSPQEAYPGQYASILCAELGRTVELHSYFPSQSYNEWATLAWWKEKLSGDKGLRDDLAAASVVVLWAMGSHDVVPALALGACGGAWPDPLKACFEAATAKIPAQTDELFGAISTLVPGGVSVLAADAYLPPAVLRRWAGQPYWEQLRPIIDPRPAIEPLALKYGFRFADTETAFNGRTGTAMPADGLFQADGLHPTAEGSLAIAKVIAEADGLGN